MAILLSMVAAGVLNGSIRDDGPLPEVYEQVFLHRILHSVQFVVAVQLVYLFSFVPVLVPLL